MKIWIVSDLHTESHFWQPAWIPDHDVMVIAGDLTEGRLDVVRQLHNIARWHPAPILFVPGNHDIYYAPIDSFDRGGDRLRDDGVHTLSSGQSVVIGGVRFVGATLWTDFAIADDVYASESWAARHMPEYQHVINDDDGGRLWPAHTRLAHAQHRDAIKGVLSTPHDGPTVVVTHHAPSRRSIKGSVGVEDAAFATDCEYLMREYKPELWVHGHVHQRCHYWIEDTQVVCNPRGYVTGTWDAWREETGFEEDLVLEV